MIADAPNVVSTFDGIRSIAARTIARSESPIASEKTLISTLFILLSLDSSTSVFGSCRDALVKSDKNPPNISHEFFQDYEIRN
jgi:hypothetical protein